MKQTNFLHLCLAILFFLSACSESLSRSTTDLIARATPLPVSPTTQAVSPTSTATSPPSIAETGRILWVSSSTDLFNRVVTVDPQNRERLAYCSPGEIHISLDAGKTWDAIPITEVASAAAEQGFMLYSGESSSDSICLAVTLDPNHPSTFYAIFSTALEEFGAPPVYFMGFFTTDNGVTWQLVPTPEMSTIEDFGGFWNLGGEGIKALFNSGGQDKDAAVLKTNDGGKTWQSGELSCPTSGPCFRWGPAPSNIPGMGSPLPQEILSSSDGGSTWESIDPPVELRAPAPNQLVAFSDDEIAIVSGSIALADPGLEASPLRFSADTGSRLQHIEIPPLAPSDIEFTYFPGLQILPDESYLSQDPETNNWFWLNPNLPIWCPLNTNRLPNIPQLLQNAGGRLWWINAENNQIESISISELGCAES